MGWRWNRNCNCIWAYWLILCVCVYLWARRVRDVFLRYGLSTQSDFLFSSTIRASFTDISKQSDDSWVCVCVCTTVPVVVVSAKMLQHRNRISLFSCKSRNTWPILYSPILVLFALTVPWTTVTSTIILSILSAIETLLLALKCHCVHVCPECRSFSGCFVVLFFFSGCDSAFGSYIFVIVCRRFRWFHAANTHMVYSSQCKR